MFDIFRPDNLCSWKLLQQCTLLSILARASSGPSMITTRTSALHDPVIAQHSTGSCVILHPIPIALSPPCVYCLSFWHVMPGCDEKRALAVFTNENVFMWCRRSCPVSWAAWGSPWAPCP